MAENPALEVLGELDPLVHAPARLKILAVLYAVEAADFLYLEGETGLTRGNLSSHLTKLEQAKYLTIEKRFVGKKPRTTCSLTETGREAFEGYRRQLEAILEGLPGG